MRVLLVGGGGREHAIAQALKRSPQVEKLYCAPGNAGIAQIAECVPIGTMDFDALTAFASENDIDLTVCSMDDPLCAGIACQCGDHRRQQGFFQGSDEEIRHSYRRL